MVRAGQDLEVIVFHNHETRWHLLGKGLSACHLFFLRQFNSICLSCWELDVNLIVSGPEITCLPSFNTSVRNHNFERRTFSLTPYLTLQLYLATHFPIYQTAESTVPIIKLFMEIHAPRDVIMATDSRDLTLFRVMRMEIGGRLVYVKVSFLSYSTVNPRYNDCISSKRRCH